jgi:cell wall-associated NlpC family hydrolase
MKRDYPLVMKKFLLSLLMVGIATSCTAGPSQSPAENLISTVPSQAAQSSAVSSPVYIEATTPTKVEPSEEPSDMPTASATFTPTAILTPTVLFTPTASLIPTYTPEPIESVLLRAYNSIPPTDYLGNKDDYSAMPDLSDFKCFSGKTEPEQQECLRQVGLYYYDKFKDLPYMWGGNYPYSYSTALALKSAGDPFLNLRSIEIMEVEENRDYAGIYSGRSGLPMKAGFDCSGFVFWLMAHAGQPSFLAGDCANPDLANKGYFRCDAGPQMDIGRVIEGVGKDAVQLSTILEYGKPGDLVFTPGHVMFYLGEGQVLQSSAYEQINGPDNGGLTQDWIDEWTLLHPSLGINERGGVNITSLSSMGTSFFIRRYTVP